MNRLENIKASFGSKNVYDYVILGGGISGLQCA
jgi:glycerol-3-phosphate dehydrogenase